MSYSMEICNRIVNFLEDDDWKYRIDTDKEIIKTGLTLKGKMKSVDIVFDLRDDKYLLYVTLPLNADEGEYDEVRDLMNRINYGIMFGCFEMDDRDGEIRLRYPVDCDNQYPCQEVIKHSLYRSCATVMKYADAFVQVIMGVSTGKAAYENAQKKD